VSPEIRDARADDLQAVRALLREYERSLGVDLGFQGFAEELERLPGEFRPEARGALLVAAGGSGLAGCVALRAWSQRDCELKRLYVVPAARGSGLGRRLAEAALERAHDLGYARVLLDTLPSMHAARRLYRSLGFVATQPYRENPVPGTAFLALDLSRGQTRLTP